MARTTLGLLVAVALVGAASAVIAPANLLWPQPAHTTISGDIRLLDPNFAIEAEAPTQLLADAMERYIQIISFAAGGLGDDDDFVPEDDDATFGGFGPMFAPDGTPDPSDVFITSLHIYCHGCDSDPDFTPADVDYSYGLDVDADSSVARINANSVFGCIYGMETFSQLVISGGYFAANEVHIQDAPGFKHRGLMVDSGRRFAPVPMLLSMMDAMSYTKMNILHLHLSDWAAVRMEVPGLPELTADLNGQFYTAEDAAELVDYATARGIRIIAEIDVPGHSKGFAPLVSRGLSFCDSTMTLLYNDPAGKTLALVEQVVEATAKAFPDAVFHVGGDETVPNTKCPITMVHDFEKKLQAFVRSIGRQPMVWNEVFSLPPASIPNAAEAGTIVQNWDKSSSNTTTLKGYDTVVSLYDELYLDQQCCAAGNFSASKGDHLKQCYWFDLTEKVLPSHVNLVAGGETAMWGDIYCEAPHCLHNGTYAWMYNPDHAEQFMSSFMGMVWPRAAAAGASFWHFNSSLQSDSDEFYERMAAHNYRLQNRGVDSCPTGCVCDWGYRCGKPYGATPNYTMEVVITNKCKFNVDVKQVTPCQKGHGAKLAQLRPNQTYTARTDFIVEGGNAAGDPYDEWFGGPGWQIDYHEINVIVDPAAPTYLEYDVIV